jgi:hypothetical protein
MFAYFTKINSINSINSNYIISYTHNMISLYFNEDDYNDDEYLFNTQTIVNWANEYNVKLISFIPDNEIIFNSNNDIIPLFSYS